MKPRDVSVNSSRAGVRPETLARLEAIRRLAQGAAHGLNNALTTLIGETSFLLDERKHDAVVVETCQAILTELERCSRLTGTLLTRRGSGQSGSGEVDVVRLVRGVSLRLSETLGGNNQLAVEAPDQLLVVAGDADALELVVLTLTQYAAEHAGGPAKLTLTVDAAAADAQVRLRIGAEGVKHPRAMAESLLDPTRAPDEVTRLVLESVSRIVRDHRGSRYATATGPDAWTALIVLPQLRQDERA